MSRNTKFLKGFVILVLSATLSLSMLGISKSNTEYWGSPLQPTNSSLALSSNESAPAHETHKFKPTVSKPAWVDKNDNAIADSLDREIVNRLGNDTAQEYARVIVMLKSAPTAYDTNTFVSCGGCVTTPLWTEATYGFGGTIRYDRIANFIRQNSNALLVEKDAVGQATVAYAAKQIGARPYVWNTLGLQGDPQSSIAVLDTGIDGSHIDFSPGYGDLNFSKKIVGWNDQTTPGGASPYDNGGHGSHCAGLAAGNGFFSTDASGYATATVSANYTVGFGSTSTFISGMMVNKTGTITIWVAWDNPTGNSYLYEAGLYYGDKNLDSNSWTKVASAFPYLENSWFAMTYSVASIPSGGYDMYHVKLTLTSPYAPYGSVYAVTKMWWPYTPPADGFSAWTGIAPQAKLVGVKILYYNGSGLASGFISGVNWIITNRQAYHITIASMSVAYPAEFSIIDSVVVNLVNSGVTAVVAAGNFQSGANNIFPPGEVDEVITVAAMNQFDSVTVYSSQGGTSRYTGQTTKPDITAPGGSFSAVPLFSVDTNHNDALHWADIFLNDSTSMQGTSQATPIVSGAANIVIQAMGGFSNWQWTRSQALQPKMILLMTATETCPNLRESKTGAYSPTLERGGKDVHEGYGRLNLDAAVDAILRTYTIGTTITDTLGRPPTITDISVLGQKLAWARKIQLNSQARYNFTISVPADADFDLYLYNSTGTTYGEPAIVANSTIATTGGNEQIIITPPYDGTYYLVVKRATTTTGTGTFTLRSTAIIPGDINSDLTVNNADLILLQQAYGAVPISPNWKPNADLNKDYKIDVSDLYVLSRNYGKTA
jgi:subtilisin family serine protease